MPDPGLGRSVQQELTRRIAGPCCSGIMRGHRQGAALGAFQIVELAASAHLIACHREPSVVIGGLHLKHAAFGNLPLPGPALLHLLGRA